VGEAAEPSKAEVFCGLYTQDSSVFLHVDARHLDVQLPEHLRGQPHVVLQIGRNCVIPISDLVADEAGVSCTLIFNRRPFWCAVPWDAVFGIASADDPVRGALWDPPPEALAPMKSPAALPEIKRRTLPPGWAVIDGGKLQRDLPDAG
jgi:hypothetical protein